MITFEEAAIAFAKMLMRAEKSEIELNQAREEIKRLLDISPKDGPENGD